MSLFLDIRDFPILDCSFENRGVFRTSLITGISPTQTVPEWYSNMDNKKFYK